MAALGLVIGRRTVADNGRTAESNDAAESKSESYSVVTAALHSLYRILCVRGKLSADVDPRERADEARYATDRGFCDINGHRASWLAGVPVRSVRAINTASSGDAGCGNSASAAVVRACFGRRRHRRPLGVTSPFVTSSHTASERNCWTSSTQQQQRRQQWRFQPQNYGSRALTALWSTDHSRVLSVRPQATMHFTNRKKISALATGFRR